jgi:ankyrin repeat protein
MVHPLQDEFIEAIKQGDKTKVEELVKQDKELLNISLDIKGTPKGINSILAAAYYGRKEIYEYFEGMNVHTELSRCYGFNSLHMAAAGGQIEMVEFLLKTYKSLKIDSVDDYGGNVIHHAVRHGQIEMVKFLLQTYECLKIDSIDSSARNVLHYAAVGSRKEMIEFLLKTYEFLKIDSIGSNGMNALHIAVMRDDVELIKFLHTEKKMNINAPSNEGTPLDLAEKYKKNLAVEYLKTIGAISTIPAIVSNPSNVNNNAAPSALRQPVAAPQPVVATPITKQLYQPSPQINTNINSSILTIVTQQVQDINELKKRVIELEKNDKQKTDELKKQQETITKLQSMFESLKESVNTLKRPREDDGQPLQKKARLDTKDIEIPDLNELPADEEIPSTALRDNNAESVRGLVINQLQA